MAKNLSFAPTLRHILALIAPAVRVCWGIINWSANIIFLLILSRVARDKLLQIKAS